jgi:hypothetical protein
VVIPTLNEALTIRDFPDCCRPGLAPAGEDLTAVAPAVFSYASTKAPSPPGRGSSLLSQLLTAV